MMAHGLLSRLACPSMVVSLTCTSIRFQAVNRLHDDESLAGATGESCVCCMRAFCITAMFCIARLASIMHCVGLPTRRRALVRRAGMTIAGSRSAAYFEAQRRIAVTIRNMYEVGQRVPPLASAMSLSAAQAWDSSHRVVGHPSPSYLDIYIPCLPECVTPTESSLSTQVLAALVITLLRLEIDGSSGFSSTLCWRNTASHRRTACGEATPLARVQDPFKG